MNSSPPLWRSVHINLFSIIYKDMYYTMVYLLLSTELSTVYCTVVRLHIPKLHGSDDVYVHI